ncbi:MAG: NAD-dependent epimerase/dehydratase family protein [Ferrovibrio sp.]
MSARHFLVTGGTGFLGAALVRRLLRDGHKVRVLDNNSRGATRRLDGVHDDVDMRTADVRDVGAVAHAVKGVDAVIHMAAVNGTEFFYSRPELVLDVAVRGMLAVVDACRLHDVGDLVVASSSEVYQTPRQIPTDESVPLVVPDVMNPRYSYGGGKILSELIAVNYGRTGFDRIAIFRPHNVYGPDMGWEHVLPQLILRARDAVAAHPAGPVPLQIQGTGSQQRAFIHVDDFTDALVCVIERGAHLNLYHLGNPEELSVAEVASRILAKMGREVRLVASPEPPGATPRRCPDISKVRALGFTPAIPFDKGVGGTVDWYVANAHLLPAAS